MKNWPDQLYRLLPAVHQIRDGNEGEPLRAFLQIIGEQTQQIQDDIEQLYDNWFIETSDDWVVPYLGDLVGFRHPGAGGEPADAITARGQRLNRFLYPRREIANLVRRRRRKGTLSVLEDMAHDVSGWASRAVEFSRLVNFFQNVQHPQPGLGRTFKLGDAESLARVNTPFDVVAHTVDVRSMQSRPGVGWYHPKKVGLFVWRRKILSATMVSPCRACRKIEQCEVRYCTFSRLGIEHPIYVRPAAETDELHIADETNLPVPLYRHLLADKAGHPKDIYYGLPVDVPKSLAIYRRVSGDQDWSLVPAEKILIADLSDSTTVSLFQQMCGDEMAVDPERGLLLFGCKADPCEIRVSYHYAATMEIGSGEYKRQVIDKPDTEVVRVRNDDCCTNGKLDNLFEVAFREQPEANQAGSRCQPRLTGQRLLRVQPENPDKMATWIVDDDLCIEITRSDSFQVPAGEILSIRPGKTLIIRGALEAWPLLHLQPLGIDTCHLPWRVQMGEGSKLVIDGLLVCGATMQLDEGDKGDVLDVDSSTCRPCSGAQSVEPSVSNVPELHLRHATFVPGGIADSCLGCQQASLCLNLPEGKVAIRHSIIGTLNVDHSSCSNCCDPKPKPRLPCPVDPISIEVSDSIVDAAYMLPAIYSNCGSPAHATLVAERTTILGDVCVQQMSRAEDSLFAGIVHVQRRGEGYMRYCYVPAPPETASPKTTDADSCGLLRTPPRFKCIPETGMLSTDAVCQTGCDNSTTSKTVADPAVPRFVSTEYGHPGYCELRLDCATAILRGAEDQSEVGVFHDLYSPQRASALQARLREYTPADMQSAVIYADDLHPERFGKPRHPSP